MPKRSDPDLILQTLPDFNISCFPKSGNSCEVGLSRKGWRAKGHLESFSAESMSQPICLKLSTKQIPIPV